ncbi:hypothetical protein CKO15_12540 [Halorhodospira abdelmalekii]|uniref:hypothetical protein n=1 Tax=Halorhodospira abdelmalekii TaxID=421629 RepID=UPI0019088DC7|nr:hypothetical protein [Halorhodospira abdelmalekii]MBK1736084.1 hypothetical protein [Halorhodospira abdelmalekii]
MDRLTATPPAEHVAAAYVLLERWQRLYAQGLSAAPILAQCERALLHHLRLIGPQTSAMEPGSGAFLHWGAQLLAQPPVIPGTGSPAAASLAAFNALIGDAETRDAALRAWLWCTPAGTPAATLPVAMLSLMLEGEGEAPADSWTERLWRSCSACGVVMPTEILAQAWRHESPAVRAGALRYLVDAGQRESLPAPSHVWPLQQGADWPTVASLTDSTASTSGSGVALTQNPQLRRARLRVGVAHGALTREGLARALEAASDHSYEALLLRAAAGDSTLPEQLALCLERNAEWVLPLAALTGTTAGAEFLLEVLAEPRYRSAAGTAWQLLTGRPLALQPQLRVAGSGRRPDAVLRIGYRPDVAQAQRWWRDHCGLFDEAEQGVLLGEPLTDRTLARALTGYGGWLIEPLLEVAVLRLGWRRLGLSGEQTCERRQAVLACPHKRTEGVAESLGKR